MKLMCKHHKNHQDTMMAQQNDRKATMEISKKRINQNNSLMIRDNTRVQRLHTRYLQGDIISKTQAL